MKNFIQQVVKMFKHRRFKGSYFASPESHAWAIQVLRDYINQKYPPEERERMYKIYNIPPEIIK